MAVQNLGLPTEGPNTESRMPQDLQDFSDNAGRSAPNLNKINEQKHHQVTLRDFAVQIKKYLQMQLVCKASRGHDGTSRVAPRVWGSDAVAVPHSAAGVLYLQQQVIAVIDKG